MGLAAVPFVQQKLFRIASQLLFLPRDRAENKNGMADAVLTNKIYSSCCFHRINTLDVCEAKEARQVSILV
jgi:hypothetical protein